MISRCAGRPALRRTVQSLLGNRSEVLETLLVWNREENIGPGSLWVHMFSRCNLRPYRLPVDQKFRRVKVSYSSLAKSIRIVAPKERLRCSSGQGAAMNFGLMQAVRLSRAFA